MIAAVLALAVLSSSRPLYAASIAADVPRYVPPPSTPIEKIADAIATDVVWACFGAGADLASTAAALRWCPACRESNPLGFNAEARISLKFMGLAIQLGEAYRTRRHGRDKEATRARIVGAFLNGVLVANNLTHLARKR